MADLVTVKIRDLIETQSVATTDYMVVEKSTGTYKCEARYLKGATGVTPNVTVGNTNTLPPGQLATVTRRGSNEAPVFDFGIPQGIQGPQGPQGNPGSASISINDNTNDTEHAWSGSKINSEISKVMNGIEDMQGVKYQAYKNYLIMSGTKNGVVKDLKLYGKSLVNLWGNKANDFSFSGQTTFNPSNQLIELTTTTNRFSNAFVKNLDKLKANTYYTLIVNVTENTLVSDNNIFINNPNGIAGGAFEDVVKIGGGKTGTFAYKVKTRIDFDSLTDRATGLRTYVDALAGIEGKKVKFQIVLLEGDYTQNPPQYFEGIASVGNGNEIEVLSVNSNILDKDKLLSISTNVFPTIKNNGFEVDYSSVISIPYYEVICTKEMFLSLNVVKKGSGDIIVRGYKNVDDLKASSSFTFNKGISLTGNISGMQIPIGTNFVAFHRGNANTGLVEIDDIMVTFDSSTVKYISHKQDKKPILFKDADGNWKPVTELRGIDLNNCDIVDSNKNKFYKNFNIRPYQSGDENNNNVITDKTNTIYKLDKQIIYDINPIELELYEDETAYIVKSGPISPNSELYADSNLGSLMVNVLKRMSRIESEVFKPIITTQMAMLAGDYRTAANILYPQDFVSDVDKEVIE